MERKKGKQQRKEKKLSFFNLIEQRILYFERLDKKKTASNYICAFKHFKRFRGDQDIAIEDLTVGQMKDFQSYLIGEGLRMNTISLYNRELRAVYNYALDEEIIQMDKRPFRKSFTGQEPLTAGLSNVWRFSPLLTRRCSDLPETCFCSVSICRECPLLTWLISKRNK